MKLSIKPSHKNTYPLGGILIKNTSAQAWLREIQSLNIHLSAVQIYPIPGTVANSVWGCLIISSQKIDVQKIGKNEACQIVHPNLLIPEKTALYPAITSIEIEKLFSSARHIMHPEFGLAELTEELNAEELIAQPQKKNIDISIPEKNIFIPGQIKSFQVHTLSPEEILKELEDNGFPKNEGLKDYPLDIFEKAKLSFYQMALGKRTDENANIRGGADSELGWLGKSIGFVGGLFLGLTGALLVGAGALAFTLLKGGGWSEEMSGDFKDLEERNKNKLDKLLELLKNNPEEGLKYAIPLDSDGTSRGGFGGEFNFFKRWFDFSLFGSSGVSSGSGASADADSFFKLQNQYRETAEELVRQKEYKKAAFIYMKLLKDYNKAADVLEEGKLYKEAATVYLKYLNNKLKAAQCYEKGNMIDNAIELYIELNENEKVGDLYLIINKRKEADVYFNKVADAYKASNQFVKASLVYKYKMQQPDLGQESLLHGWRLNADAFNCLNNYFSNIKDIKELKQSIGTIYEHEVWPKNREVFLKVIDYEFARNNELADYLKEIAYEIVAAQVGVNPAIVSELKKYNPADKELMKDTIRYIRDRRINKNS